MAREIASVGSDQTYGSLFITDSLGLTNVRLDSGAWKFAAEDARVLTAHYGVDSDADEDYTDALFRLVVTIKDSALAQEPLPNDVSKTAGGPVSGEQARPGR